MTAYEQLLALVRPIYVLGSIGRVLRWDAETMMPHAAIAYRAEQLSELHRLVHERFTDPHLGALLQAAEEEPLDPIARANVRELKRDYEQARKLPSEFVAEMARLTALAKKAWAQAKRENDFQQFAPFLKQILDRIREKAEYLGYEKNPYDALLDQYEPGATVESVGAMFRPLQEALSEVLFTVERSSRRGGRDRLRVPVPEERQREFGAAVAAEIGFCFDAGRLDVSEHPFCTGFHPRDVRLTTRFRKEEPLSSFFAILHEAGHGMYEQGLPEEHVLTPCGEPASLGVHESQSRFWENCIGRSLPFWERYFPRLQEAFGSAFREMTLEEFYRSVNAVEPDYIRVEADELTYNLHILIRFELEEALVNRRLDVAELPEAWNEKLKHYLGLEPPEPARGVLQDIHWSMGAFGYFPTYTLGNLYAAQLRAALWRDLDGVETLIRNGEFAPILEWLRERVHRHGRFYPPSELIERATGAPASGEDFLAYVREKYLPLYSGG
ncbi:MAG: carboxypeptidase M32 [Candidatus Poribacteria bacterium]|nr:MAG: carboxypeptidase M32 [Candidatus Poribacteria bacterium]